MSQRIAVERQPIGIFGAEAESRQGAYRAVNPQGLVPALVTQEGSLLTQSLAIVEYLDEIAPEPPLLPADPEARAFARSIAAAVASEIHALLPPRIAAQLKSLPGIGDDEVRAWNRHFVGEGMAAVEALIARRGASPFAAGEAPSIADIFLFPQAIGAERGGFALDQWPSIAAIVERLRAIPAFADNAPAPRT